MDAKTFPDPRKHFKKMFAPSDIAYTILSTDWKSPPLVMEYEE